MTSTEKGGSCHLLPFFVKVENSLAKESQRGREEKKKRESNNPWHQHLTRRLMSSMDQRREGGKIILFAMNIQYEAMRLVILSVAFFFCTPCITER